MTPAQRIIDQWRLEDRNRYQQAKDGHGWVRPRPARARCMGTPEACPVCLLEQQIVNGEAHRYSLAAALERIDALELAQRDLRPAQPRDPQDPRIAKRARRPSFLGGTWIPDEQGW